MMVKFSIPNPTPRWAVSDHSKVNRCGPTMDERRAELADSLTEWNAARDEAGDSYKYTRVTSSFFANRTFETTFVVENGVVVERVEMHQIGSEEATEAFRETGASEPTRVCTLSPLSMTSTTSARPTFSRSTTRFINLSFVDGFLRTCTSFHRQCQDDCSRGPVISSIGL